MDKPSKVFLDFRLHPGYKGKENKKGRLIYVYRGNSMYPTLKDPVLLEVLPYRGSKIWKGDIVCFSVKGKLEIVVHRVVRIDESGITTRGDNNFGEDDWILAKDRVIGKVIALFKGSQRHALLNGWLGYLYVAINRGFWRLFRVVLNRISPLQQTLKVGNFIDKYIPVNLRPKVMQFQFEGQAQLFLYWFGIVIGRYSFTRNQWLIRLPFCLMVNEHLLPGGQKD